jgi:hypothetical protein
MMDLLAQLGDALRGLGLIHRGNSSTRSKPAEGGRRARRAARRSRREALTG